MREFVILICFRGKLKGKRGVGVVSPVTVRNRSCHLVLGSGILQAAPNAVHSMHTPGKFNAHYTHFPFV